MIHRRRRPLRPPPPVLWLPIPPDVLVKARTVGEARQHAKTGYTTVRLDPADPARENVLGYLGEATFNAHWGLPAPEPWADQVKGDGGWDFDLPGRPRGNGKCCANKPWCLSAKERDFGEQRAAYYVLAWCAVPNVGFFGWATHQDLEEKGDWYIWPQLGNRARVLPVRFLRDVQELR